ncbi:DUF4349 domain-containing protein [Ornithinimicrobium cavernae]|uniref:DUF4349 domain-containing protein n=1 Tax=Ornithinimicrobium cavernae TaxID=2666047 RepID=UPI000D687799|nr:DUF4349 domain-containing protein [Ornithinimicrobium cavernae]
MTLPHGSPTRLVATLIAAATLTFSAGCSSSGTDRASDMAEPASGGGAVQEAQGGSDDSGADGGQPGLAETGQQADPDDTEAQARPGSAEGEQAETVSQQLPEGEMIARDATLGLAVEDVTAAAADVRAAAAAAEGWVVSEELQPDAGPEVFDGHAALVLSVPSGRLDATLEQLGPTGRVTRSTVTSLNVTQDYRDTTTRIATLEASISRVRALMEEATDIEDVVLLEGELAQREAELEVLKAHATTLEDDVARSSITVTLDEVDPDEPVRTEPEDEPTGFAAGIAGGWEAFLQGVTFVLTAVGALLPFAAAAALLTAPVLWWRRRRSGSAARGSTPGTDPAARADA